MGKERTPPRHNKSGAAVHRCVIRLSAQRDKTRVALLRAAELLGG